MGHGRHLTGGATPADLWDEQRTGTGLQGSWLATVPPQHRRTVRPSTVVTLTGCEASP